MDAATKKRVITCCEWGLADELRGILANDSSSVAFVDPDDFNPLMTAIHNHHQGVVDLLLARPDVHVAKTTNRFMSTPLHVAAYRRNLDAMNAILIACAPSELHDVVNAVDVWNKTALHHAVYHCFDAGIERILSTGVAETRARDRYGKRAIEYASNAHIANLLPDEGSA